MFCSSVCKFSVYGLILLITYHEEPKGRMRLIEVEVLENIRPKRKVAP